MTLEAVLWDVDGTLAETERDGHRVAFNQAFAAAGLPWRWDVDHYGRLLAVTGGRERLLADFAQRPDAPADLAEREGVRAEPEALNLIGRLADGAMRDGESLLERMLAAMEGR